MMLRVFKETFVGLNYRGRAEMSVEMSIEMRRDRIATTILSNGERNFWAEIKGIRSNQVQVSRNIDDLTEAENTAKADHSDRLAAVSNMRQSRNGRVCLRCLR
jgi:hypothetical protein